MTTEKVIELAAKNVSGELDTGPVFDSARLCLADAKQLYKEGNFEYAKKRAIRSLAFSVGVFHRDYLLADGKVR